jgi:hypothetical protein
VHPGAGRLPQWEIAERFTAHSPRSFMHADRARLAARSARDSPAATVRTRSRGLATNIGEWDAWARVAIGSSKQRQESSMSPRVAMVIDSNGSRDEVLGPCGFCIRSHGVAVAVIEGGWMLMEGHKTC